MKTLLDLLIGVGEKKKKRWKQVRQHKTGKICIVGSKPKVKIGLFCLEYNGISWPMVLLFFPLPEKKSTKLHEAIQRCPICGAEYALQAQKLAWDASLPKGTAGSKVFWSTRVSHIPQYREGKRSMLGAGPKAGHCMALSWQVNHLSHTARCRISSLFCSANQS